MNEQDLHDDLPGFDEPLALLRACHKNITDHCERLENLITHIMHRELMMRPARRPAILSAISRPARCYIIVTRRRTCSRG